MNLGFWHRDPGAAFRARLRQGMAEAGLPRGLRLRHCPAHVLRSIVMRSDSTVNTLTFEKLSGETDGYTIALRQETDDYRAVLGNRSSGTRQENGCPTSARGKLFRK